MTRIGVPTRPVKPVTELGGTDLADRYRSELLDVWSGADTEHPLAREVRGDR